ncbi:hypothetical protein Bca4012_048744 [Brassica carinata]
MDSLQLDLSNIIRDLDTPVKTFSAPVLQFLEHADSWWHYKNHVGSIRISLQDWDIPQRTFEFSPTLVDC